MCVCVGVGGGGVWVGEGVCVCACKRDFISLTAHSLSLLLPLNTS